MQKNPHLFEEAYEFLFKIMIPAFVGIAAKVAIQMKNEKLSIGRVVISFIAGVSCAYFAFPLIENISSKEYLPAFVGLTAISGEKITEWVVYKFKIDIFLGAFADFLLDKIRNKK